MLTFDKYKKYFLIKSYYNYAKNKAIQFLSHMLWKKKFILIREMAELDKERKLTPLMIERLDFVRCSSLELVANEIYENKVSGSVAELGVSQGLFARHINYLFPDRVLYLFDTFEGFDERDWVVEKEKFPDSVWQEFKVKDIQKVMDRMPYKDKCIIKKGYFPDSIDGLEEKFCFVSIDVDLYQPILEGLRYFYPRLNQGGYIFVHDYNQSWYKGVKQALREFCEESGCALFPLSDYGGTAVISKGSQK